MKVVQKLVPAILALAALEAAFYWLTRIPALKPYHAPAIACDIVAILSLPFSIWVVSDSRLDKWGALPAITALLAWIGFGWTLTDKPCLAGFCGFLGLALLFSITAVRFFGYVLFRNDAAERKFASFITDFGIFLVFAACALGPITQ